MADYDSILEAMTSRYTALTGNSPDDASDIGVRLKTLACQLAELCGEAETLRLQSFPLTAAGEALEMHAASRGLARKAGSKASGALAFSREHAAGYDTRIPAGTICQTAGDAPLRFVTAQDAVLPGNLLSAEVPAEAEETGRAGNVTAGQVMAMVNPPQGITAVTNAAAFFGGTDAETDDALRERLRESYRPLSNGANAAYYRALALSQEGVGSAAVLPLARGVGTVDIAVWGEGQPVPATAVARLQALADAKKSLGVDVLARQAETVDVDLTAAVAPADGWSYESAEAAARAAALAYFAGLGVGEPALLAGLFSALMGAPGVANCRITAPAADVRPLGDRAVRAGTLTLSQMEVA